jgi:hypothetical protein
VHQHDRADADTDRRSSQPEELALLRLAAYFAVG